MPLPQMELGLAMMQKSSMFQPLSCRPLSLRSSKRTFTVSLVMKLLIGTSWNIHWLSTWCCWPSAVPPLCQATFWLA